MQLLEAEHLVNLKTRNGAHSLKNDLALYLLTLLGVSTMVRQPLYLIHDHLHEPIVACQEVDVGDTEDRLLRDVRERTVGVCLDRMSTPNIKAYEVVYLLEGFQHDVARHWHIKMCNHPRDNLHATQVAFAAHDNDLLATMLHERSDVLNRESAVTVQDDLLARTLSIVHLPKRAVLDVTVEQVFPWKLDLTAIAKIARPS
mmetsp:Transcript_64778/g.163077  ORF Transcript_64778/g.163077 Transcript_64778/m.163077 type:complete len:201 (+) Transcript_64778:550-1152(+)